MSDAPFHTAVIQDVKLFVASSVDTGVCTHGAITRIPGPSCQALRHAVSCLYRLDDFELEKIGVGFFSDVYKVTVLYSQCQHINTVNQNEKAAKRHSLLMVLFCLFSQFLTINCFNCVVWHILDM